MQRAARRNRERGQLGPLFETAAPATVSSLQWWSNTAKHSLEQHSGKKHTLQQHSGEKHTVEQHTTSWSNTLCGATRWKEVHCGQNLEALCGATHYDAEQDWAAAGPFGEPSYFGHASRTRGGLGLGVRRMKIEES